MLDTVDRSPAARLNQLFDQGAQALSGLGLCLHDKRSQHPANAKEIAQAIDAKKLASFERLSLGCVKIETCARCDKVTGARAEHRFEERPVREIVMVEKPHSPESSNTYFDVVEGMRMTCLDCNQSRTVICLDC